MEWGVDGMELYWRSGVDGMVFGICCYGTMTRVDTFFFCFTSKHRALVGSIGVLFNAA